MGTDNSVFELCTVTLLVIELDKNTTDLFQIFIERKKFTIITNCHTNIKMSILNNLPTNPYSYPKHDCYWLVKHIRNYYGLETPDFTWTHKKYLTASDQPRNLTLTCLRTCAKIRQGKPKHLDLAVFKQSLASDLGTVIVESGAMYIIYQSAIGAIAEPINRRLFRCVDSYWFLL